MKTWEQREAEAGFANDGSLTLLQARVKARKTQRELAEIAGISHQGYRCIEKGVYACNDEVYNKLIEVIGTFKR